MGLQLDVVLHERNCFPLGANQSVRPIGKSRGFQRPYTSTCTCADCVIGGLGATEMSFTSSLSIARERQRPTYYPRNARAHGRLVYAVAVGVFLLVFSTQAFPAAATCRGESACGSCASSFWNLRGVHAWEDVGNKATRTATLSISAGWRRARVTFGFLSSRWECTFLDLDCAADMTVSTTMNGVAVPSLSLTSWANCWVVDVTIPVTPGSLSLSNYCTNDEYNCQYNRKADVTCVSDCAGRACGGDGCGGTCGTCQGGNRCALL